LKFSILLKPDVGLMDESEKSFAFTE